MADIEIISIDLDDLDLDDETRALLESCLPDETFDIAAVLTEEKIAGSMLVTGLVKVH